MRNGRRIMAMLLVVTLVFSMVPAAAAEGFAKTQTWMKNQFSDVADEHCALDIFIMSRALTSWGS